MFGHSGGVALATYTPPAKPRGALKWGYNLPIALYRLRLGWLLGHHFLMLTHRGRKSGHLRRNLLARVPARLSRGHELPGLPV